MRREKGGYIVFVAIMMAALIGVGALALDLGRMFVLRSEMQNAADSAALAAAAELDRNEGAISRATTAAQYLLDYQSRFAERAELLGGDIAVSFYCHIGSDQDGDPVDDCGVSDPDELEPDADGRYTTGDDEYARYARVSLQALDNDANAYSIRLYFLPVLNAMGNNAPNRSTLNASATAGTRMTGGLFCGHSPLILCNPFEGEGELVFKDNIQPGALLHVDIQSDSGLSSGNFGLLESPGPGATGTRDALENPEVMGCTDGVDMPLQTGVEAGPVRQGINRHFDRSQDPAPNIVDYPSANIDLSTGGLGVSHYPNPEGDNNWDPIAYWDVAQPGRPYPNPTEGPEFENWTRWQVYNWEINNNEYPSADECRVGNNPSCATGENTLLADRFKRRVLNVSFANCQSNPGEGSGDNATVTLSEPEGFARLLITQRVETGVNGDIVYLEYLDWVGLSGEGSDVIESVRLYE